MRVHARLFATGSLVAALIVQGAAAPAQQPAPQPQPPASASTPPDPQQPPAGQRPPVIRSGINFVSVDVIVTDKKSGEVVLDLKQDDFEVREDKRPQKVESFDVVKIDALTAPTNPKEIRSLYDEESEARQPNVRLFVVLLDDYHVRRGNDLSVKRPLIDFVHNQLAPQDMVAIMYPLTPVTSLTFTRSRDSLVSAINKFEGRKGIYEPRNEFEERYAYYPVQTVEKIRNDVTMDALKGAAVRLGGMRDGRKSIIFVSEGFTSTVPAQLNDQVAAMPGVGNRGVLPPANPNVQDPRAESQRFFNASEQLSRLREVYDTVNRNNTSIYAVDPRGLAVFEYDINQRVGLQQDRQDLNASLDSLHVLADNTDGRAIVNRNDLAAGMKQIMRDASGYYLLGYTSMAAPTDGKFHTIDVRVKRPNVEVRARKGYYAYTAEDAARATAPPKAGPPPEVANALNKIVEPNRGSLPARFWTGTERQADGKAKVTFVWEPLAAGPDAGRASDGAARVMLTVTGADGRPVFRGPVASTAPADGAAAPSIPAGSAAPAAAGSTGAAVSFAAPPGQLDLRMVVENGRGQVIDSTTQSLTVPDYARTQVSFSTPRLYRARTAREALLVRNNLDAPPTATREFSRAERLLIRLDAYAGDGGKPDVTAKLLNRSGSAMADVPIQTVEGKPYLIDFPLASLAAGEYIIQVNAKTASGSAQEMIGFKVGT
jgi:VWFA-related protein